MRPGGSRGVGSARCPRGGPGGRGRGGGEALPSSSAPPPPASEAPRLSEHERVPGKLPTPGLRRRHRTSSARPPALKTFLRNAVSLGAGASPAHGACLFSAPGGPVLAVAVHPAHRVCSGRQACEAEPPWDPTWPSPERQRAGPAERAGLCPRPGARQAPRVCAHGPRPV